MFNRILAVTAVLIAVFIVSVTAWVFVGKPAGGIEFRRADPDPKKVVNMNRGNENSVDAFTDIGRIRINTRTDSEDSVEIVVVAPWFSYPKGDTALYEELCQKEQLLKSVIGTYFAGFSIAELRQAGEPRIKEELLELVNDRLVLGKIRAVYFNEYIFID